MGERQHKPATSSRLGTRNTGGEIVEVQGGHILRSTGRKDRHSKVCTAKGPRDRRVRLSAHTAIEFYDVQDRLGYDRPSKAVDWLINKAKAAIDELEELPAWNPTTAAIGNTSTAATDVQGTEQQQQIAENPSFLPPSLDSDAIADTIKSFFPMGVATVSSPSLQFQSYPPDLLSRTSSQNQDLRLSLQSFQEPILLQQHQHDHAQNEQQLFLSGTTHHHHFGIDGPSAGWSEHHQNHPSEISRFQQMVAWNTADTCGATDTGSGGTSGNGGFIFNSILPQTVSPPPLFQPSFGQNNQFFSQRGPLQSSNTPSICAGIDPAADHHHHHTQISQIHQRSFGGFSGFRVPARIQGEEEEHDGIHNKPSSASSDSRH